MAKELAETIRENAQGPAESSGDSGSMRQHDWRTFRNLNYAAKISFWTRTSTAWIARTKSSIGVPLPRPFFTANL